MGKVKDEVSASKPSKPAQGEARRPSEGRFAQFLANLVRTDLYKPMQGWYARLYTALGLGVIVAAGRLAALRVARSSTRRSGGSGIPAAVGAGPGLGHLPDRPVSRRSPSS